MEDIRKTIQGKLETLGLPVFYGTADKVDDWNYIVFRRLNISGLKDKLAKTEYFQVFVISENAAEPEIDEKVISAMLEIPGMKVAGGEAEFDYTKKGNTNMNVEIVGISFCKARSKR